MNAASRRAVRSTSATAPARPASACSGWGCPAGRWDALAADLDGPGIRAGVAWNGLGDSWRFPAPPRSRATLDDAGMQIRTPADGRSLVHGEVLLASMPGVSPKVTSMAMARSGCDAERAGRRAAHADLLLHRGHCIDVPGVVHLGQVAQRAEHGRDARPIVQCLGGRRPPSSSVYGPRMAMRSPTRTSPLEKGPPACPGPLATSSKVTTFVGRSPIGRAAAGCRCSPAVRRGRPPRLVRSGRRPPGPGASAGLHRPPMLTLRKPSPRA
jgi:hypothetical protein